MTLKEIESDFSVSVQESLEEAWVDTGLLWGQGYCTGKVMQTSFTRATVMGVVDQRHTSNCHKVNQLL